MSKKYADEEVFQRDGFRCVYCGFDGRQFEGWAFLVVDHFKPKRLDQDGNTHELENLKTACCICNAMKGGSEWKDVGEARERLKLMWDQMRRYWEKNGLPLVSPEETQPGAISK